METFPLPAGPQKSGSAEKFPPPSVPHSASPPAFPKMSVQDTVAVEPRVQDIPGPCALKATIVFLTTAPFEFRRWIPAPPAVELFSTMVQFSMTGDAAFE